MCWSSLIILPSTQSQYQHEISLQPLLQGCCTNYFIVHYGIPERLHSDQGCSFECRVIRELCSILGIGKSCISPYHPSGNGIAERLNRTLLDMMGMLPVEKKTAWKDHISTVVHAYNCTKHDTIGAIPYSLMFRHHPILPVDVEYNIQREQQEYTTYKDYVKKLQEHLAYAFDLASKHCKSSQRQQATCYNKGVHGGKL